MSNYNDPDAQAHDDFLDAVSDDRWDRDHNTWDGRCNDSECPCWDDDYDDEDSDPDLYDDYDYGYDDDSHLAQWD